MDKIHIAFLWHNHQPMYKNPLTGIYELPWVRLHACKDYYDTVAILDDYPKIKSNFNLVPSLMIQLDDYARGAAHDKHMDLTLKPANDLNPDEKAFILQDFFMSNWKTMIDPNPRYKNLLDKRGRQSDKSNFIKIQKCFQVSEIRDLQVWFNLSWMDPYWREHDDFVKSLFIKGKDFTEEEKTSLIKKQLEICGMVVKKYKELQERGQIEISVTPFYHPILPLLCDSNNARGATPQINLPKKRFQHRKDAKEQIRKAVEYYKELFGVPPRGMWPSEGSVSEDVIPLFAEFGINWIATDEDILFKTKPSYSSNRHKIYQPYKLDIMGQKLNMIFRDHAMSDSFGFVYSKWDAKTAVQNFLGSIHAIYNSLKNSPNNHLVSIILDGENCWEYFPNDGWDFLRLLYESISNDPVIETVTINEYINANQNTETLTKLFPGSWINGNFGIWIGHPEDNLSWDYLYDTRKFLTNFIEKNPDKIDSPEIKSAWEKIYMAEGSDWNWWYGDDHSSENDDTFDFLFRQHLIGVYKELGEKAPDYLYKSIKGIKQKKPTLEPIDFITPKIDGRVTNYFEWHPAGYYELGNAGGSMHQVNTVLKSFYYGFDLENIYLRLDFRNSMKSDQLSELIFNVSFLNPPDNLLHLSFKNNGEINEFYLKTPVGQENLSNAAFNKIIEIAIPISKLNLTPDDNTIEFLIILLKNSSEIERWPYQSSISFPKPSKDFVLQTWSV